MLQKVIEKSFDSILVRLKVKLDIFFAVAIEKFRFHTGSIKRRVYTPRTH